MADNNEFIDQQPLDGQITFPGFEEPEPEQATAQDAEAIDKAARRISLQADMARNPEDALAARGVPTEVMRTYLARHFEALVKKAAEITGADPEQIRDKNRRTPEQDKLLTEIAGREQINRMEKFLRSRYSDAMTIALDELPLKEGQSILLGGYEVETVIPEYSAIYFFAIHPDVNPLEEGSLNDEQAEELRAIFHKLRLFFQMREKEAEETGQDLKYAETLSAFIRQENPGKAAEIIEAITVLPIDTVDFPLDKPNRTIWNSLKIADINGQLQYVLDTSKEAEKSEALIRIGLDFDGLPSDMTKNLGRYDKRCLLAAAALVNGGNAVVSATQIYKQMGNSGSPSAKDLKKINDSCTKMGIGRIFIDNTDETETHKGSPSFRYDGPILPFERVTKYINGQLCEAAFHFFREPPLITFARERKQITTVPRELLESPISKTEANLIIEDYLLDRISHMKTSRSPRKILYKTLYANCDITTSKQKQRAPEKIARYLAHYKKCGWIYDFEESPDGVTIYL